MKPVDIMFDVSVILLVYFLHYYFGKFIFARLYQLVFLDVSDEDAFCYPLDLEPGTVATFASVSMATKSFR